MSDLEFNFSSPQQETAFFDGKRNQCLCGGYGSGKTFCVCLKALALALEFPGYRTAFIRKERKVIYQTTYKTFMSICPSDLIKTDSKLDGETTLKNGSSFLWLGLDRFDVNDLKSLELNAGIMDQGEEMDEVIYTHLDGRIDRWSHVEVPEKYWKNNSSWRRNKLTGKPMAPSYNLVVCNPDLETHWIWREFHPDSMHWYHNNRDSHSYHLMPSTANAALSEENLKALLKKDPSWVDRYVYGKWGNSDSQIHKVSKASVIQPTKDWLRSFLNKAVLYRTYDHGETSPSCCIWAGAFKGTHVLYREYYQPDKPISYHRQQIADLSENEAYSANYADPEIWKKLARNKGGRYTVADEYRDVTLTKAPAIYWQPADNNELGTRNRINELLLPNEDFQHPITGESPAPRIYFVERCDEHPNGLYNSLLQLRSQKREPLEEINGKITYSDERDKRVTDHGYDAIRYYVAIHANKNEASLKKVSPNSFQAHFDRAINHQTHARKYF